jgi:hypothetical protein
MIRNSQTGGSTSRRQPKAPKTKLAQRGGGIKFKSAQTNVLVMARWEAGLDIVRGSQRRSMKNCKTTLGS